jgi:hypothetical protein
MAHLLAEAIGLIVFFHFSRALGKKRTFYKMTQKTRSAIFPEIAIPHHS